MSLSSVQYKETFLLYALLASVPAGSQALPTVVPLCQSTCSAASLSINNQLNDPNACTVSVTRQQLAYRTFIQTTIASTCANASTSTTCFLGTASETGQCGFTNSLDATNFCIISSASACCKALTNNTNATSTQTPTPSSNSTPAPTYSTTNWKLIVGLVVGIVLLLILLLLIIVLIMRRKENKQKNQPISEEALLEGGGVGTLAATHNMDSLPRHIVAPLLDPITENSPTRMLFRVTHAYTPDPQMPDELELSLDDSSKQ